MFMLSEEIDSFGWKYYLWERIEIGEKLVLENCTGMYRWNVDFYCLKQSIDFNIQ